MITQIRSLNMILNTYKYGMVINGELKEDNGRLPWSTYKTLSRKEFEKYKIGCCYDYTMYEDYWFEGNNIPHKLFYIEGGKILKTHTFLVFQNNGKHILFESSWKSKVGTFEFNSEQDLLNYFCKEFIKDLDQSDKRFVLYEFKQPKTGLTSNQYRAHIIQTGTMIRNIGRYYESVIRPWENTGFENLEESAHLKTFDYKWSDELEIVKSLPSNEQDMFFTRYCPMNILGRYILTDINNNKLGFVEVLKLQTTKGYSKDICYMNYGLLPTYRDNKYVQKLINVAIVIAQENDFKELQYRIGTSRELYIQAIEKSKLFKLKKEFKTEKVYHIML